MITISIYWQIKSRQAKSHCCYAMRRAPLNSLKNIIIFLREAGYEFEFISGLCDYLETESLPVYEMDKVIH